MLKKLLFAGIGLALISSPILASAQSADVQGKIAALQAQIQQLIKLIAQLQGQTQQSNCLDVNRTLTLGDRGDTVSNLQNYLIAKSYLHTSASGYYGFLTVTAVGNMQIDLGLVDDSSDPAFGILGPKTRAAIACTSIPTSPPPSGPSCTLTTDKKEVHPGDTITVSWTTQNATRAMFLADAEVALSGSRTEAISSLTNSSSWREAMAVSDAAGHQAKCSVEIAVVLTTGQPAASIDSASLTTTSSNPTITGSASGLSGDRKQIYLSVFDSTGAAATYNSTRASVVTDGRWSVNLSYIAPGTYTVKVYDYWTNATLTSGTLVVQGAANAYASIDPSSLSITACKDLSTPTITGSAKNTSVVGVTLSNGDKVFGSGLITVVNGHWSTTVTPAIPTGSYKVIVYDGNNNYLTSDTLSLCAGQAYLSLTSPAEGASFQLGQSIPIAWYYKNAPPNSQAVVSYTNVEPTPGQSGVGGGTWQSQKLSTSGSGSYFWQTGAAGSGLTNLTGTYAISAVIRPCDPLGCNYHYPSDDLFTNSAISNTVKITLNANTSAATIDQSSLTQPSGSFNITGTATNVSSYVSVWLVPSSYSYATDFATVSGQLGKDGIYSSPGQITAGHWTAPFNLNVSASFKVLVYDGSTKALLTTGTLTISGSPSATIDPSSLLITPSNRTVKGTGTNVAAVSYALFNSSGVSYWDSGSLAVANGVWSQNLPTYLPAGTYTIKVYSGSNNTPTGTTLAYGTLTISTLSMCPADATSQRGLNNQTFVCVCPAGFTVKSIWGGPPGYYTDDSDICTAGALDGQMNPASGGEVDYMIRAGQNSYNAYSNYGITSQSRGSWTGSFQITGPKG
jgi:hypothetical protein